MRGRITFILTLISCLLFAKNGPDLSFQYILKKDGLISAYVNVIEEDTKGFIWIGSKGGLNRIIGKTIKKYYYNINDTTSIPGSNIWEVFNDSQNNLWVSGYDGVSVYNEKYDNFISVASQRNTHGLKEVDIRKIKEDHNNIIYMASSQRVYSYNKQSKSFKELVHIPSCTIQDFIITSNNQIWIATDKSPGLFIFNLDDTSQSIDLKKLFDVEFDFITTIIQKSNSIYLGTANQGIYSYDISNKKVSHFYNKSPDSNNIIFLGLDNSNNIWSCDYTGLKLFDETDGSFFGYYPDESTKSIKSNTTGIFQDSKGNYWTYHFPGGVGLSTVQKGFSNISFDESEYMHTSSYDCSNFVQDKHGNLWIGSYGGTIDIYDRNRATIKRIRTGTLGLGKGSIMHLGKSVDNDVLVCIYNSGAFIYNEAKQLFEPFNFNTNEKISNKDIRSIIIDKDAYWLAVHGKGIDYVKDGHVTNFNSQNSKLINDWTNQLLKSKKGDLWVATSWGLYLMKKGDNDFTQFYNVDQSNKGLTTNHITCLFEDRANNIWLGTERGLFTYDYENEMFNKYLDNEHICGVTDDIYSNLWVTTSSNLIQFNPRTKKQLVYDDEDGIEVSEFTPKSVYTDPVNNDIYFGGIDGGIFFNPKELNYNYSPPNIEFTSLMLFNKTITHREHPEIIASAINNAPTINLKYNQNVFTIGFESNNFINQSKNQYSYKLEGFDKDWILNGSKREVTYTNIEPGEYIFKVKSSNNDAVWNKTPNEIIINIIPPWYKRPVTHFITVALLLLFVFILIKIRTRHLKLQQTILQREVNEKTKELVESNQELQTQAEYLTDLNLRLEKRQMKIEKQSVILKEQSKDLKKANENLKVLNETKNRLFSIISHDLISPFNSILGLTEVLKDENTLLDSNEIKLVTHKVNSSAQRVFNLLQNLLIWSKSQTDAVIFEPQPLQLRPVILETLDLLEEIIDDKNIKCKIEVSINIKVIADREMLATILRNLISNAIKFSPIEGEILIIAEVIENKVRIGIKDSGIGMSEDLTLNLFNKDQNTSREGTAGEKGSGLGLQICRDFVCKNGGKIWTESKVNKGTTFYFTLPSA